MKFELYFEPASVAECCALLKEYGKDAKLLAGGTDLVPRMRSGVLAPKAVIALYNIPGLAEVKEVEDGIILGSCYPMRKLSKSAELAKWPALQAAAGHVSSMQVRNVATIGGNACNASPSADGVEGLMIYNAEVIIASESGERKVAIADFFKGPGKTVLEEGELVTGFYLKNPAAKSGAYYHKFAIRGDTDIAIVGAGANLTLDAEGKVCEATISMASVAPTPLRAKAAEEYLIGKCVSEETAAAAAELAAEAATPITDARATAEYRKEMVKVWVRHAILDAAKAI